MVEGVLGWAIIFYLLFWVLNERGQEKIHKTFFWEGGLPKTEREKI